jgi:hypothetical protein
LIERGAGRIKGGAKLEPPISGPTLAEMGVDRKWAARAHKVAELSDDIRVQYVEELKIEGKDVTPIAGAITWWSER